MRLAPARPSVKRHKHVFTALWGHFGVYGPQNQHYHQCFTDGCETWLHGDGQDCAKEAKHWRVRF
jgi:hypothetical protein